MRKKLIKTRAFSIEKIIILTERRFFQEIRCRIGHCNQFHSPKNPSIECQIPGNCLVLIFNFDTKPSNHDIGITFCLADEELHLIKVI